MNIPTEEQCLQYFDEYHVPSKIKQHCIKVKEAAVFIAKKLNKQGININLGFVSSLAYLHDLFKIVAIDVDAPPDKYYNNKFSEEELMVAKELKEKYPGMYECDVAHEIFKEEFPELAVALKKVSRSDNTEPSWEELVVHYCDWRVFQEDIVSLKDRISYLRERYAENDNSWDIREVKVNGQEQEIFSKLNFQPEELKTELEKFKE